MATAAMANPSYLHFTTARSFATPENWLECLVGSGDAVGNYECFQIVSKYVLL